MTQEYVVVNARTTTDTNSHARLLVHKNRPAWQSGFLNLIGGKVEPGEGHEAAALRELQEETGLVSVCYLQPMLMGRIVCPDAVIYCYNVWVNEYRPLQPQAGETEKVAWFQWYDLLGDKRLMPNLRVVLPLMQAGVSNWTLDATTNSLDKEYHEVTLKLPSSGHPEHSETAGVSKVLAGYPIIEKPCHEEIPSPAVRRYRRVRRWWKWW